MEYVAAVAMLGNMAMQYSAGERQQDAMDQAREEEEAFLDAQFASNTANYQRSLKNIDEMIGYWGGLERDPRSHPGWESFERNLTQQAGERQGQLEEQLRRRGITGGRQTEVSQEIEQYVQSQLAQTLLDISRTASMRQMELEQMKPQKPYRGMPGYQGVMNVGSAYGTYPSLPQVDLSGLGMMMALQNNQSKGSNVPTTMQPGTIPFSPAADPYTNVGGEQVWWNQNYPY